MNLSVVGVVNHLKFNITLTHISIANITYLGIKLDMNKFEFKNLS